MKLLQYRMINDNTGKRRHKEISNKTSTRIGLSLTRSIQIFLVVSRLCAKYLISLWINHDHIPSFLLLQHLQGHLYLPQRQFSKTHKIKEGPKLPQISCGSQMCDVWIFFMIYTSSVKEKWEVYHQNHVSPILFIIKNHYLSNS